MSNSENLALYREQQKKRREEKRKEEKLLSTMTKKQQERYKLSKTISIYLQMKERIKENQRNRQRKEWCKVKN